MLHRLLMAAHGSGGFTVDQMTTLGWINVIDQGATGNGSTDDTAAITSSIAALPSSGGVLYFPPGTYKTSGGFTISHPCTIIGMGGGGAYGVAVSTITSTSTTAVLFTIASPGVNFYDIELINTAGSTPTSGCYGIEIVTNGGTTSGDGARYIGLTVSGFYDDIAMLRGQGWYMSGCVIDNPVSLGMVIRNENFSTGYGGEWILENTWFLARGRTGSAAQAIVFESGSGGTIHDVKSNGIWDYGLVVQPLSTLSGYLDPLIISDCMFNGIKTCAIYIAVPSSQNYHNIEIVNCHLNPGWSATASAHCIIADGSGGTLDRLMISNCSLNTETASAGASIDLNTVAKVRVTGCLTGSFASVVSQTGCTDVVVTASA